MSKPVTTVAERWGLLALLLVLIAGSLYGMWWFVDRCGRLPHGAEVINEVLGWSACR